MKNPVLAYRLLITGLVLYILLSKKKKTPCNCPKTAPVNDAETPVAATPKDPILSTMPVKPVPIVDEGTVCREKSIVRYKDMEKHIINWVNGKAIMATYKLRWSGINPIPIGVVPEYTYPTVEEYAQYCKDYREGKYTTRPKLVL